MSHFIRRVSNSKFRPRAIQRCNRFSLILIFLKMPEQNDFFSLSVQGGQKVWTSLFALPFLKNLTNFIDSFFILSVTRCGLTIHRKFSICPPLAATIALKRFGKFSTIDASCSTGISSQAFCRARFKASSLVCLVAQALFCRIDQTE